MTDYESFYIQKSPQAFDDTLVAFGLAKVIAELLERQGGGRITLLDRGAYYELALSQSLQHDTVEHEITTLAPAEALATAKTHLPSDIRYVQYEDVREQVEMFFQARRQGNEDVPFPDKPWDVYRALNPASLPGYNSLMVDWHIARTDPETLFILLDLYAALPNNYDEASECWKTLDKHHGWNIKPDATRQQLYNPDSGKGQNKSKADGLSIGNVSNFWLTEWLKAVGFYEVALTKQLRGVKDRKTLVLAPRKLTFDQHQRIMSYFSETMRVAESAIRFDVLAAIRYTRQLLRYIIESNDPLLDLFGLGSVKQTLVSGFHTAFYKDMGNAIATMNLSFIALPGWVVVQSPDDVPVYQAMLDELDSVVRQFDENHSDDFTLLLHLRDFISGDDLRSFLKFTTSYAGFYMQKRERGYAIALSPDFIERIVQVMGNHLAELADRQKHPGFHNVAAAIATVTVWAQYDKEKSPYKIRYGLHRDIARQAQNSKRLLAALGEFIHSYNAETMRAKELGKLNTGNLIEPEDIDDVVKIVALFENDSKLVAEILLAYGSTFSKFIWRSTEQEQI